LTRHRFFVIIFPGWKGLFLFLLIIVGTISEARQIEYYIKRGKEKSVIYQVLKLINLFFINIQPVKQVAKNA